MFRRDRSVARPGPLSARTFGTLDHGGLAVNQYVPKEIIEVLQAVIILAVAGWPALGLVLALLLGGAASISSRLAAAGRAAEGRLAAPVREGES